MDGFTKDAGTGERLGFTSAGNRITVEWYRPRQPGRRPAVLMLHGRDGPSRFRAGYRHAAQVLASRGYHAVLVHYFESTEDGDVLGPNGLSNFLAWMRAVDDGVSWVASQPDVDAARIALLGVSLGAAVALAQAGQDDRVRAVVDFYGGLPAPALAFLRRMPPTLILHGAQDWLVPVSAAYQLEAMLRSRQTPYEMQIYPDQGHGFHGEAAEDAVRRTLAFLDRHVGAAEPAASGPLQATPR